jgi:4-hydroxy-2-oxoheptanedioate aldolase
MRENTTKQRLERGETVLGCWFRSADPTLVEYVSQLGWDFLVFDGEHGTLEPQGCENLVRAAELHDVTPIVRVTTNQRHILLRYMDTGAQGAQIPMVNTADEAEAAVTSIKYGPRGVRGLAAVRASGFGRAMPYAEYIRRSNESTLVVTQIETPEAIDNLPAILAVDGVDVAFLGLIDLSAALGVPGETGHPDVLAAIDRVIAALRSSRCALGVLVPGIEAANAWRARGARYIAVTFEGLVAETSLRYLEAVRA